MYLKKILTKTEFERIFLDKIHIKIGDDSDRSLTCIGSSKLFINNQLEIDVL